MCILHVSLDIRNYYLGHLCEERKVGCPAENELWPVESDDEEEEADEAPFEVMLSEPTINKEQEEERISLHAIGENKSLDLT